MGSDKAAVRRMRWIIVFQFTLPHGERLRPLRRAVASPSFNSRSRMGSDLGLGAAEDLVQVSIHAPAWGATRLSRPPGRLRAVSIHAPAWGATVNPCPSLRHRPVSIHAPAWGATRRAVAEGSPPGVSIHAPAWGATGFQSFDCWDLGRFNSRSRMGSDEVARRARPGGTCFNSRSRMGSDAWRWSRSRRRRVSIHAPAWGATADYASWRLIGQVSIHAPAWGATPEPPSRYGIPGVSIHAPAWGATHAEDRTGRQRGRFNSRSRMGSDSATPSTRPRSRVSIHAPAWGATPRHTPTLARIRVSIHAPAWGATPPTPPTRRPPMFQFTLPHGERLKPTPAIGDCHGFNSRSRMGSDRNGPRQ